MSNSGNECGVNIELNDMDIHSNKFWTQLFQIINSCYQVAYITYKGKNYFNCSNTWYDAKYALKYMKDNNIVPCHEDNNDEEYTKHVKQSQIEYKFMGNFNYEEIIDLLIYEDENEAFDKVDIHPTIENLSINFRSLTPEKIIFISTTNIILKNDAGINEDYRGADKTHIALPFSNKIKLNKEFTLKDLLVANTQLKSHKFDNNYEMYCGTECEITANNVIVNINMDHGS